MESSRTPQPREDNPVTPDNLIIRIDDRLIHGQVLIGWGSRLRLAKIVVGNDHIAANEWERQLLLMSAPPEANAEVRTLAETLNFINGWTGGKDHAMVLLNGLVDLLWMAEHGLAPQAINVGGIHFKEGRREVLPYLFLSADDIEAARRLLAMGFILECLDVPTGNRRPLETLLEALP